MARVTLQSRFPEIAVEMRPRISKALQMGADDMASSARMRVPVEHGALRETIEVRPAGAGSWAVNAGSREAFYAGFVEWGTSQAPAQPYLVPAAEWGTPRTVELVEIVLRQL